MNTVVDNLEFDIKLVELVSSNPLLYGKELRASPYETTRKKIELWKSIAVSLKTDSRYCITRWKALKDRFQRELQKAKEFRKKGIGGKTSTWVMYEKLLFLRSNMKCHGAFEKGTQSHNQTSWNRMNAENLAQEYDDDPLQEAMDEQSNYEKDRNEAVTTTASSTTASVTSIAEQSAKNMRRIEVLLEGIDDANRGKAEKRIVTYLCKCQIKSLNNEDIDNVTI